jgi:hypothetical protein
MPDHLLADSSSLIQSASDLISIGSLSFWLDGWFFGLIGGGGGM